ncbi:Carbohydrate binding family 6 [Stanieria cyanosphaera PCC 7437]|uniref:Carbohydrate binding family 6 n=1 Tax=Stanieria cyanosphaera (strain ATCC 29371 / PCC 7437) TaxID=111780 RepID=K9XTH9_STAC7|nr:carbohydrate-binding protein [Stanieria cyanosphaera]AFZ34972.1 Carbohydrate binding family 6 [Stanieria cyanosphaera PCC 7437]
MDIQSGIDFGTNTVTGIDTNVEPLLQQSSFNEMSQMITNGARIEAESFSSYYDLDPLNQGNQYRYDEGVDIEQTTDEGGGYNVGWLENGEWLEYTTNVTEGTYDIKVRVASAIEDPGSLQVKLGDELLGTVDITGTGGWQNWQTLTIEDVQLAGSQEQSLRLEVKDGGLFNINWLEFESVGNSGKQSSFNEMSQMINNGARIEAESFSSYYDLDPLNQGNQYRYDEGVDIEQTKDEGGGYNVGWLENGEWLEYTTNVTEGTYDIKVRVASAIEDPGSLQVKLGNELLGTVDVTGTGGWQNWQTLKIEGIQIPAGQEQLLRLEVKDGGLFNINWLEFESVDNSANVDRNHNHNHDHSQDECHLQVDGRFLYDANGEKVIMRGIESVVRYGQYQGSGEWNDPYENGSLIDGNGDNVAEIAKTGANAIRLIGGRPEEFERAIEKAIENNLWVSIGHVDFRDTKVMEIIKKYECYVTLHAQGEVVHEDENKWREDSIKAIQEIRELGYEAPIEITAGFYGQRFEMILNQGQAIFDADPLKNVVFVTQAYSEIENRGGMSANLDKLKNFPVPVFVGASNFGLGLENGYGNNSNTYKQVWEGTQTRDLSSFYWVWSDAGYGDVISSNRKFDGLTSVGKYLVYDSPANLSSHAPKTEWLLDSELLLQSNL